MADALQDLGQRIVEAARLAVAMHLSDVLLTDGAGRQVGVGGADQDRFTDEAPPAARGSWPRSFPSAEGGAG